MVNDGTDTETGQPTHYEVSRPTIEDIPRLLDLWKEQYEYHHGLDAVYYVPYSDELNDKVKGYLEKVVQEDEEHILVAKNGDDLVGFITFGVEEESYFDTNIRKYGELKELLVTESARGTGAGGVLVRSVEKRLQDSGVPFAVIKCSSFNTTALEVYKKMGYTVRQETLYKPL